MPELVATQDKKGMSAMDVGAVLTKIVLQEQQEALKERQEAISELRDRITEIEKEKQEK